MLESGVHHMLPWPSESLVVFHDSASSGAPQHARPITTKRPEHPSGATENDNFQRTIPTESHSDTHNPFSRIYHWDQSVRSNLVRLIKKANQHRHMQYHPASPARRVHPATQKL